MSIAKNLTVRLDEQLAADTEALARAEGKSLNETVKQALRESVERRRSDPELSQQRGIAKRDRTTVAPTRRRLLSVRSQSDTVD